MNIKLHDKFDIKILDIVDYKSIIKSYNILNDNIDTLRNFLYSWDLIFELSPLIRIRYIIYLNDIQDKKTYLEFFNFMLKELSRAERIIKIPSGNKGKRFVQNYMYNCNYYHNDDMVYYLDNKVKNKSEWDSIIKKIQKDIINYQQNF